MAADIPAAEDAPTSFIAPPSVGQGMRRHVVVRLSGVASGLLQAQRGQDRRLPCREAVPRPKECLVLRLELREPALQRLELGLGSVLVAPPLLEATLRLQAPNACSVVLAQLPWKPRAGQLGNRTPGRRTGRRSHQRRSSPG